MSSISQMKYEKFKLVWIINSYLAHMLEFLIASF